MNIDEISGLNPKQQDLIHVHVAPHPRQNLPSRGTQGGGGGIIDAAWLGISLEPT